MGEWAASFLLLGALSTGSVLPFWSNAGQNGLYPDSDGALAVAGVYKPFNEEKAFDWRIGVSGALRLDGFASGTRSTSDVIPRDINPRFDPLPDECYASVRWKPLVLDLGLRHDEPDFMACVPSLGSLSLTGGHLVRSGNARPLPGYELTLRPWAVPFTKEHLFLFGSWGDFISIDRRYDQGSLLHRVKFGFTVRPVRWMDITLALDHYAQWGGTAVDGKPLVKVNWGNYWRIITGQKGGPDATQGDQMNVLGCHGGAELIRFDFRGKGWKIVFQHEIPYADKSGMLLHNFPDGVNTLAFSFDDKKRWVSDVLYEFTYTMNQSGTLHDPETDPSGKPIPWDPSRSYDGLDNYFNNGGYRSGFTHFGRPVTSALFYPQGTKDGSWSRQGITLGIENNRVIAHHIGLSGYLFQYAPYRLMLTFSQNYGRFGSPYAGEDPAGKPEGSVKEIPLLQFSAGFSGEVPVGPLYLTYALYGDVGEVLQKSFAVLFGLRYRL